MVTNRSRSSTAARSLASHGIGREALTFGAIGLASTAAYAVLYLVLRAAAEPAVANAFALVLTAVGNTAANRRLTFGVRDGGSMLRDQLVALGIALAITTASVGVLAILAPEAGRPVEVAVLVVANGLATVARFVLLRAWITGDRHPVPSPVNAAPLQQENLR